MTARTDAPGVESKLHWLCKSNPKKLDRTSHLSIASETASGVLPCKDKTTPSTLSAIAVNSLDHALNWVPAATFASMILDGCIALGLGARGNLSEVPEFGGLNADSGNFGRLLGPFRRTPTPGGDGGGTEDMDALLVRGLVVYIVSWNVWGEDAVSRGR